MRFWWRELLGLFLVALALYIFYDIYDVKFSGGHYVETVTWAIVGIFIFRGGIQLMKVALAARVCTEVQPRPAEVRRTPSESRTLSPGRTAPLGQT